MRHTADIINSSEADLILFAGHSLSSNSNVDELNKLVDNDKTTAVIGVKENAISELNPVRNALFLLQNGIVRSLFTHQLFRDSKAIDAYPLLGNWKQGEILLLLIEMWPLFNVEKTTF